MRYKHFSIFLLFGIITVLLSGHLNTALAKICDEKSIHGKVTSLNKLKDCSVIEGRLVISLMHNATKEDFEKYSFPELKEITDFLLVYQVEGLFSLGRLFPNLTIIRGQKLFTDRYALYVSDANHLEEIGLQNLASIERGLVAFENNPQLCYATSIDWNYLTKDRSGNEFKNNKAICNVCSESCPKTNVYDSKSKATNRYLCWSERHCQRFCKNCKSRSCYKNENSNSNECCPDQCMGSCYKQQLTIGQLKNQMPLPKRIAKRSGEQNETAHICMICRYAELTNGTCADRCPAGFYRYKERRCVTKEECIKKSKIYQNNDPSNRKDSILFKPVDIDLNQESVCVEDCPDGFMINPENGHSCVRCGNKCYQQCETKKVIDSLAASEKYKKCTVVNGDLIISMQENSPDLMQTLTDNLGSIEMITGYLRITKSYALQTLSFFKSLREIQGQTLDRKDYSLLVIDNANLQELFTWNRSMNNFNNPLQVPQIKLGRGKVFFQLNPKLCLNKIFELKNYTNINYKNLNDTADVSDVSNGDKAACIIKKIDVFLEESYYDKLKIRWTHFRPGDFRTLLSYDIYYKESKDQNVSSQFDNRDFCNSNGWTYAYHDVNSDELLDNKSAINIFTDLKAATQYAFFIKANVLINRTKENPADLSTGQSDIVYFRTKPTQPLYPEKLTLTPGTNEIEADWSPPLFPNGKIEYYRVTVEKKSPDEESSKLHCEDTTKETYNTNAFSSEEQPAKEKSSNETEPQASCRCSAAKSSNDEDNVTKRMNIENNLHNLIYYKSNSNTLVEINKKYLDDINSNELRINLNSTKFKEQLKNVELDERQKQILSRYDSPNSTGRSFHMKLDEFRAFNFNVDQLKKLELNVTNLAKIGLDKQTIDQFDLSEPEQTLFDRYGDYYRETISSKERRMRRAEEQSDTQSAFRRWIKRSINDSPTGVNQTLNKASEKTFVRTIITNNTRVKIEGLEHYTEYIISVSACQNISATELALEEQCSTNTTQFMFTRPVPGANVITNVTVDSKKISEKNEVLINWSEPESPNGPINSYKIDYKLANSDNKFSTICVPRQDYKAINGYAIKDLQPGVYSFRIIAQSDGSKGKWTELQAFEVPERYTRYYVGFGVLTLILVACVAIGGACVYKSKKYESNYFSVNADYMAYEPDEWEINREDVKFDAKNQLGRGNYGIVYRGEYRPKDGTVTAVAVKTTNSSEERERYQFLNEASLMKHIKCFHVVSLVGVVSKGIPVLVLMEMMEIGDLRSYLKKQRPPDTSAIVYQSFDQVEKSSDVTSEDKETPNSRRASKKQQNNNNEANGKDPKMDWCDLPLEQLFLWAIQIADGMAYLSTNKFVHRDLAARNCLLSSDLIVKIGDFGMSRDVYKVDFYQKSTRGNLPIRWSSPEALKDGLYNTQSDVWSFGVVLWEMVTLGCQPYQGLSNEEVLSFVRDNNGRMEKPLNCPKYFYNIMELCWSQEPKQRPSFTELIQLLLPYVSEEAIARMKFEERSFYFEQKRKEQMGLDEQSETKPSRREFKKKDYMNDKDRPPDDGSDRPLTETEKSDLMDSTFIQYNNNSNTSSENHRLSDFTVQGDRADEPLMNHQASSEFLENGGSMASLSGTDSNDKDDLSKPILVKPAERSIVPMHHPLTTMTNGPQECRKSRQESISCQSSSSASESNGENFETLIDADTNAPLNGNLPNGNILLNS